MNKPSPNFSCALFKRFLEFDEGPTLDFKYSWKDKLISDETTFRDFARHVIAFGNISYRTGKPCYIVYGVDNSTKKLHSLHGEFPGTPPEKADESSAALSYLMEDGVLNKILRSLGEWIKPEVPILNLEYGEIEDEGVNKLVAWLEIRAGEQHLPYCLRKGITSRGYFYRKKQFFIRKGSNTVILDDNQADHLPKHNEAVYLTKNHWRELINEHRSKDFLESFNLIPFIPFKGVNNCELVEETVISALEEGKKFIAIIGAAGSGKSLLLRRIGYRLASKHLDSDGQVINSVIRNEFGDHSPDESKSLPDEYVVRDISDELEPLPHFPIPIYLPLRIDFNEIADFEKILTHKIAKISGCNPKVNVEEFFAISRSQWILLLDGLDEIHNPDDRCPKIGYWIRYLPKNVQVVLTSRPYIPIGNSDITLKIKHLTSKEIIEFTAQRLDMAKAELPKKITDNDPALKLIEWIKGHKEIWPLLANHRALSAFTYHILNIAPTKPSIDIGKVELISKVYYQPSEKKYEGNSPPKSIPIDQLLSADPLTNQESTNNEEYQYDEDSLFSTHSLNIGKILRQITNEMREQEKIRKEFLPHHESLDDEARLHLENIAWFSNWNTHIIDIEMCKAKNCYQKHSWEWNENIGFIKRHNYHLYHFICKLYQLYLAAEYSIRQPNEQPSTMSKDNNRERVIDLRRQLSD